MRRLSHCLDRHPCSRWIVQYTAVHAISIDAGTTMRRRYQTRWAEYQPTRRNAVPITASCPASTPTLNVKQRRHELRARQAELFQRSRETHPVQQAERKDERHAPRLELGEEDVLDRDVCNRQRNQRLDDPRRHGDDAVHAQAQRDRVSHRERAHLPENGARAAAEQVDAEHEQHVVQAAGHDVGEAEREIAARGAKPIDGWRGRLQRNGRTALPALQPLRRRVVRRPRCGPSRRRTRTSSRSARSGASRSTVSGRSTGWSRSATPPHRHRATPRT